MTSARIAVAVALVAFAVCGLPSVGRKPASSSESAAMSPADRALLKTIYTNAARVVRADGAGEQQIANTEQLRAVHVAILKFVWAGIGGNQPGKYPGLAEKIDSVLSEAIGSDQKTVTPEVRERAAKAFLSIADGV